MKTQISKSICEGQKFGHNFVLVGGDCTECGISQFTLSGGVKPIAEKDRDYLGDLKKRVEANKDKKIQATYHQHLALETAKMLDDMRSLGIYMRLFKRYHHYDLIRCRDWVMGKQDCTNRGK